MKVKQLRAEVEAQRDLVNAQTADLAARALQLKETQHALAGLQATAQHAQWECAAAKQVWRWPWRCDDPCCTALAPVLGREA